MKFIGFVLAAVVALAAGYADAADLKAAPLPVKAAAVPYVDMYSGFYVGAEFGYGFNLGDIGSSPVSLGTLANAPQGFVGGGFLGFGQRIPGLFPSLDGYIGLEGNFDGANLSGTASMPSFLTLSSKDGWLASVRARFGLIYQNVMFYGTTGWGWGGTSLSAFDPSGSTIASNSQTQNGFTWGGGVEFPWFFGPNWKARFQYLQYDFGTNAACVVTTCNTTTPFVITQKDRVDTLMAGLSYKF